MIHKNSTSGTEDELFEKELAVRRRLAIEVGGAFEDPDLDAWLTEQEQEPGYWERRAALSEKLWPSKKEPEQDGGTNANAAPSSAEDG